MKQTKFSSKVWTAIFCFLFWELLTCSFSLRDIVLGIVFSIGTAMFTARFFIHDQNGRMWNPIRMLLMAAYAVGPFMAELFKANVDVAFRVFEKDMKLNPGIVRIPVELEDEYALSMLANSITLTPGTITMEVEEDEEGKNYFYVHWLDVASRDPQEAADTIKGTFEPWIRRIWQ